MESWNHSLGAIVNNGSFIGRNLAAGTAQALLPACQPIKSPSGALLDQRFTPLGTGGLQFLLSSRFLRRRGKHNLPGPFHKPPPFVSGLTMARNSLTNFAAAPLSLAHCA